MKLQAKKSLVTSSLYPLLKNYRLNFTEKVGTLPVRTNYSCYPNPINKELKQLYAQHLNIYENCVLDNKNILFTAGCTEAIDLCLRAYGKSINNKVVFFDPVIPLFNHLAITNDLISEKLILENKNYDKFPKNIPNCSIIYICNPNNPTGLIFKLDEITKIVQNAKGLVVIDETYIEFSNNQSCLSLIKNYLNVIVLRSFSKGWGLAGLRAGAVIASPNIILNLQKQQLPFSVNVIALEKINQGIIGYKKIIKNILSINNSKEYIYKKLLQYPNDLNFFKSDTNFIFIQFKNKKLYEYLISNEKLFITNFSYLVSYSLRLSIYYKKNNLNFLNKIKYFLIDMQSNFDLQKEKQVKV